MVKMDKDQIFFDQLEYTGSSTKLPQGDYYWFSIDQMFIKIDEDWFHVSIEEYPKDLFDMCKKESWGLYCKFHPENKDF